MRPVLPILAFLCAWLTGATALAGNPGPGESPAASSQPAAVLQIGLHLSPAAFSPNGDGRKDETAIGVSSAEPATVTVRVLQGATEHRRWVVVLGSGGSETIVWDGRNETGALLDDGSYTVEATGIDSAGVTSATVTTPVAIDRIPPSVDWRELPPLTSADKPIRFAFRAADPSGPVEVRVVVHGDNRQLDARTDVVQSGNSMISWKPRDRGASLYPGNYRVRLEVMDAAGNLAMSQMRPLAVARPVPGRVFRRLPGAGNRVAITIDDCHYARPWRRMLEALDALDAKATFFCPGDRMLIFKSLTRRTVWEGHVLGSHGWDHAAFAGMGATAAIRRLRRDSRTAWNLARVTTAPYFRPPYGSMGRSTARLAGRAGHGRVIMWDVTTGDTGRPGPGVITRRAVGGARRGSIILMHTLDQTATALPAIIRGLRRKGLRPVTLPELFRAAGYR